MGKNQELDNEEQLDDDGNPIVEVELDDDGNPIVEVELDDDGNPIKVVEAWQKTEEEEDDDLPDVPVKKHIKMKEKLKGRIRDRDDELGRLRQENADLKSSGTAVTELPPRPKVEDFESDELYEAALTDWEDKRLDVKLAAQNDETQKAAAVNSFKAATKKAVDAHYDRSAQLVKDSGIKAEYFKEADTTVRETVDAILPKQGDAVTDHIISLLGEGSEKVMFFVGRNKAARLEFQSLLAEDKTGMKAMVYLGQQKERLTNPKKPTSKAPKPASDVRGDAAPNQKAAALKKKYDKAHSEGKSQIAYTIKKQAKEAKVDVSSW